MLLTRNNPKEILEFEGIKCQITSSPTIVNKRGPVFQVKNVQEGDVSLLFGTLVNIKDKVYCKRKKTLVSVKMSFYEED